MGGRLKIALLLSPALVVIGVLFAGGLVSAAFGNEPVITSAIVFALPAVLALVILLSYLKPSGTDEGRGFAGLGKVS